LRKTLSIVDVYETLWEEECDRLFSSKPRVIESQLLPALLAPYPSSSSQEAYHSFFPSTDPSGDTPKGLLGDTFDPSRGYVHKKRDRASKKARENPLRFRGLVILPDAVKAGSNRENDPL